MRRLPCNKEQKVIFQNLCWLFCVQQTVWIPSPNNQEGLKIDITQNFEAVLNASLATNHCPKGLAASCTFPAALWPLCLSRYPAQQGCLGQKPAQQPIIDGAQGRNQPWQPGTAGAWGRNQSGSPAQVGLSTPGHRGVHPCCSPWCILQPKSRLGLRLTGQ